MSKNPTALYLQGGPGLNCAVERAWFSDSCGVLWWDQPRFAADAANAYQTTLDAAAEKLAELHARQGVPIHVIGWSFGARLALDLAHRYPEHIATLTLLAPTFYLETAFQRLAARLTQLGVGGAPLSSAIASLDTARSHDTFLGLATELLATPDLLGHYWAPGDEILYHRHRAEAAKTEWFDLPTFIAVSRDLLNRRLPEPAPTGINSIRILAGRHDPYFDPENDFEHWKKLLPQASIQIVDSGHMIPFEIHAAEWLNSAHPGAL